MQNIQNSKNLLLTYSGKTAILITPRENIEKGNGSSTLPITQKLLKALF